MHIKTANFIKKYAFFVWFLGLALFMWVTVIFLGDSSYADEGTHLRQIHRFMKGKYYLLSDLTTIPGYHLVIATIAKIFSKPSSQQIRLISLFISLGSIGMFFLVAKQLEVKDKFTRTLQFVFLPVSFFYFPFIYTDIFSLFIVLVAFYFLLKKRYDLSAFFALISMLVRQNNIIWAAFFWSYAYVCENGFSFSFRLFKAFLRSTLGYLLIFGLFLLFVCMNNGIAIGDRENQQVGFYLGNIYFLLVTIAVLFLPLLSGFFYEREKNNFKPSSFFYLSVGILFSLSFIFFMPELHMYNLKLKFLRNLILQQAYHGHAWLYACAVFLGYLAIFQFKLEKKFVILLPFILLYLIPSMLIEQRYYIIPLVFMLLFRREAANRKSEYALVLYFFLLSTGLIYMLLKKNLFF